jgi:ligand-binding sensor domain-containing protein
MDPAVFRYFRGDFGMSLTAVTVFFLNPLIVIVLKTQFGSVGFVQEEPMKKIFFAVLFLSVFIVQAQSLMKIDDKSDGEEYQIEQRRRSFYESRGLEDIVNPFLLRARAVKEQQLSMKNKRGSFPAHWTSVGPSPMTMLNWRMGDVAGRIDALAVDEGAPNTMYLGAASGGLWKTYDGGLSWSSIGDELGTQSIGCIVIDPHNHNRIWVGTGEHASYCSHYFGLGLIMSDDAGQSFTPVNGSGNQTLNLSFISSVYIDPGSPDTLLAGGHGYCQGASQLSGGLYRSTDLGNSWTKLKDSPVNDLIADPSNPTVVYMSVGKYGESDSGVYRSSNSGQTWSKQTSGLPSSGSMRRLRIALSYNNPHYLYALINMNDGHTSLYRSTSSGQTWNLVNDDACEGQCSYNLCLAVHPLDPDTVLVGTIRFALSTDGGVTLNTVTSSWGRRQEVHQDTHVIFWLPQNPDVFWVGSDGGLWGTSDMGTTFTNYNAGLNMTQLYDIAVHPDDSSIIFGGAQDNSSQKTTGDAIWDVTLVSGDGFMNLIDPQHPEYVFQTSYPWDDLPVMFLSSNGGISFHSVNTNGLTQGDPWPWKTPMEIAEPTTPAHKTPVFVASNKVYRSFDYGTSWLQISDILPLSGSKSISVMTAQTIDQKAVMYVGTVDGGLFRTDDAMGNQVSWENVTGNYPGGQVTDIAMRKGDGRFVYVTRGRMTGDHLYTSQNGGSDWQATGTGLPAVPANSVCVDPRSPHRVFVGTDIGVYISEDDGAHFEPLMNGMPSGNVVVDMEIDDSPYVLTAASFGRGAWQMHLPEVQTIPVPSFYENPEHPVETQGGQTRVFMTNPYSEEITFQIDLLDAHGKVTTLETMTIPGRGSENTMVETVHMAQVRFSGSLLPLTVLTKEDTSKLAGLYDPGFSVSSELLVTHLARDRSLFYTGFSLVSDKDAGVSWVPDQGTGSSFNLLGNEVNNFELGTLLGSGTVPFYGRFSADQGAGLHGTQSFGYWNGWERAALLPLGDPGSKQLIFPHVAANTQLFWTGLVALNAQSSQANVQVRFFGQDGELKQEQALTIPAGQKEVMLFDHLVETAESSLPMDPFPEGVAWVEFKSNVIIQGFELFGNSDSGSDYLEGVRAVSQTMDHAVAPCLYQGEGQWFGIALVNPGEISSEILMVLRDQGGLYVGAYGFTLDAGVKSTHVLSDLFTEAERALASTLWIEVTGGDGVVGMALFGDTSSPRIKLGGYELIPVKTEKLGIFNP